MLLAGEFGVLVGEPPAKLAFSKARPIRPGSWGFEPRTTAGGGRNGVGEGDCRVCAVAGDVWVRLAAGREGKEFVGPIGGLSHESEHDLALMFHKHAVEQYESDLLSTVHSLLLSMSENDLHTFKGDGQCNASCIRQYLVKLLRLSDYDAAVCTSKWQGFDKVPGGDHEYIDVIVNGNVGGSDRLIIDIDFRSHFEIARAIDSYDAILTSLPVVYVGSLPRLKQLLQVMADAAKYSLKQNSMPLPPWRSLSYLQAKWFSKHERKPNPDREDISSSSDHKQCIGHLKRLKASLQLETEAERLLKPITNDKKRMTKFDRRRPSLLGI